MPISAHQHYQTVGQFGNKKKLNSFTKLQHLQQLSAFSVPSLDIAFQALLTQNHGRMRSSQNQLIFSDKHFSNRWELRILILLLLIGPTMSQIFEQNPEYSIKNSDENNEVQQHFAYSQAIDFPTDTSINQFSDPVVLQKDPVANTNIKPLFNEEMTFKHNDLSRIIPKLFPDYPSAEGICLGLTGLVSLLDPLQIAKFVKDSKFEKPEIQVLLAYALSIQSPSFCYKPENDLPGKYEVKFRDGTSLKAENLSGLFKGLVKKGRHTEKSILKKVAPVDSAKNFSYIFSKYIAEGKLYYLNSISHSVLIQQHGGELRLFDPNYGFSIIGSLEELYSKIAYQKVLCDSELNLHLWEISGKHTHKNAKQAISKLAPKMLNTILEMAVTESDLPTLSVLFNKFLKEDKNKHNMGTTLLSQAIRVHANSEIIKWIYTNFRIDINAPIDSLNTYLSQAIISENLSAVEEFLSYKEIDPNRLNPQKNPPLLIAVATRNIALVKLLLDHKAVEVDKAGVHNITPLYCAAQDAQHQIVEILLKAGANPVCVVLTEGNITTPLIVAAYNGYIEVVKLLLNQTIQDPFISVALAFAKEAGHNAVAKIIEEHLSNKNIETTTPFANMHSSSSSKQLKNEL